MISGVTSIAMDDVGHALGEAISQYRIHEKRVDIVNQEQIITALQELDTLSYDALAIVRGGGPGLEVLDSITIARAALALKTPLITAVGHAQDVTLLEQIADRHLPTPTALGDYLRRITETTHDAVLLPSPTPAKAPAISTPPEPKAVQKRIPYKDILIVILALIVVYLLFALGFS